MSRYDGYKKFRIIGLEKSKKFGSGNTFKNSQVIHSGVYYKKNSLKNILCIKGKKLIPLCFQAENIKHSKKPNKFYELVETLGNNRIDLFARNKRSGWDVWGNEI